MPYFTGWSYGFATQYQRLVKDVNSPDYDGYVYKYMWKADTPYNCLYSMEIP